jgi:NhaA family Na+:H+ antiporter
VEIILGLFGLCNAAVAFSSVGTGTWLVLAGLLLGKPLGITLLTLIAEKVFGLQIPEGMGYKHVITLGCVAGIGFTVALFVSVAAFPEGGAALDSVKMGALLSFGAAVLSFVVAKALGVKPTTPEPEAASE